MIPDLTEKLAHLEPQGFPSAELRKIVSDAVENLVAQPKIRGREGTAAMNRELTTYLDMCEAWGIAPPQNLVQAIRRQLNVSGQRRNTPRDQVKRDQAIDLLAQNPNMSNGTVARACDVSLPTVAAWKRKSDFQLWLWLHSEYYLIPAEERQSLEAPFQAGLRSLANKLHVDEERKSNGNRHQQMVALFRYWAPRAAILWTVTKFLRKKDSTGRRPSSARTSR